MKHIFQDGPGNVWARLFNLGWRIGRNEGPRPVRHHARYTKPLKAQAKARRRRRNQIARASRKANRR